MKVILVLAFRMTIIRTSVKVMNLPRQKNVWSGIEKQESPFSIRKTTQLELIATSKSLVFWEEGAASFKKHNLSVCFGNPFTILLVLWTVFHLEKAKVIGMGVEKVFRHLGLGKRGISKCRRLSPEMR